MNANAETAVSLGALIPVVVSLITKATATSRLRALVAALLAIVTAVYTGWPTPDPTMIGNAALTFGAALVAQLGWTHLDLNRRLLPRFGVGGPGR